MDNSKLYRAVFNCEKPYIDTNNTNTIIVNCGWDEKRYQQLISAMNERIGENWYDVLNVSQSDSDFQLEYSVTRFENASSDSHFLLLVEQKNSCSEESFQNIERIVRILMQNNSQSNRTVSAVLVLETTDVEQINSELLKVLNVNGIDVFLYNEIEETTELVVNACVGIIIVKCYKNYCKLGSFKNDAAGKIDTVCQHGFGENTKIGKDISNGTIPSLQWMSLACRCSDQSTDYLNSCFHQLIKKGLKSIDENVFFEAADEFYEEHFRHMQVDTKYLLNAVNNTPMIIKPSYEQDQIKLERLFRDLYGSDGSMIVDLSLKITMAKNLIANNNPDDDAEKALTHIYKAVTRYGTEDLYSFVKESFVAYRKHLEGVLESERNGLKLLLEKSSSEYQRVLAEYVKKYQAVFLLQKKIEFWEFVQTTLSKDKWKKYHDESRELAVQLTQLLEYLERNLTGDRNNGIGQVTQQFTPYELLHPEECRELCDLLRDKYQEIPISSNNVNCANDLRWLFRLNQHPSFQHDYKAGFITDDQRYQISIECKCGKYLVAR